jgi:hypothetical protein
MTTRRRWIAGLALGLLGVALAVIELNSRSERPDVQFLFIGYTNVLSRSRVGALDSGIVVFKKAVLLVTNCGSVPVQVLPLGEAYDRTNMFAHFVSYLFLKPLVLKPGESVRVESFLGSVGQILRAEIAYHRLDLSHRLCQRARSSTNAAARVVAKLIPRQPKPRWARSKPITNSFTSYVSRYHITAPPPPVTYDMLFAPRNE